VKEWGEKNDTEVIVDNIGLAGVNARAAAEASAQQGHDLISFNWLPPSFENQTVDMKDAYQEAELEAGQAHRAGAGEHVQPEDEEALRVLALVHAGPVNYRQDLFGEVGMPDGPRTWDDVRTAGARIKKQCGNPIGVGLAQEIDTGMAMRTVM
jgi:multiple sugar transport system substrate-binding protein